MKEPPLQASRERLHQFGMIRQRFDFIAPQGTLAEAVLEPTYWVRLHDRLRVYDLIFVIEEAGAWVAELLVLSSGAHSVSIAPIKGIALGGNVGVTGASPRNRTGLSVAYRGPQLRWCVMSAEGEPLRENCATEAEAYGLLNDLTRAQQ